MLDCKDITKGIPFFFFTQTKLLTKHNNLLKLMPKKCYSNHIIKKFLQIFFLEYQFRYEPG
jgi:hypothetical protein